MNRYFLIRRLRWPAVLLLAGCIALLNQTGAIDHSVATVYSVAPHPDGPVLLLAERMSLTAEGDFPTGYPGATYAGTPYTGAPASTPAQPTAVETTSIVPAHSHDFGDSNGGQS
jgi:hypothetical protein